MAYPAFVSMVVETLEDVSACHFTDPSVCPDCPDRRGCAQEVEIELKLKYPYAQWTRLIDEALGGRLPV